MNNSPENQFLTQIIATNGLIRSKNIVSHLSSQDISFEITPGIILEREEYETQQFHSRWLSTLLCQRKITIGEIGCAQAHRNAAANFLDSHFKFGIIFEDDAVIEKDIDLNLIKKFLDCNEPRIIQFGWLPGFAVASSQIEPKSEVYQLATPATCAFAYALNKTAAKLIVNNNKKLIDLADWPIYLLGKVNFLTFFEPIASASQDPKSSTIGVRTNELTDNLINRLLFRMRLVLSFIYLLAISKFIETRLNFRQIIYRMFLRDYIYNFGRSKTVDLENNQGKLNPVLLPIRATKLLDALKFTKF